MDEGTPETAASKQPARSEMDASVSVVSSSWPGWIRTHLPDEDDLPRRRRAEVLRPNPRSTSAETGPLDRT